VVRESDKGDVAAYVSSLFPENVEAVAYAAGDSSVASANILAHVKTCTPLLHSLNNDVRAVTKAISNRAGVAYLSPESVGALDVPADDALAVKDKSLLESWAADGVVLEHHPNFKPSCDLAVPSPPPRKLFDRVRPAGLTLMSRMLDKGCAIALHTHHARVLFPRFNVLPVHWVYKPTNPLGRLIADASAGDLSFNGSGVELKDLAASVYGKIELPRESDVAQYIIDRCRVVDNPRIHINDVQGAFGRLLLHPTSALFSCMDVTLDAGEQVTLIQTSMFMGGTACPYAYQTVARVLERLLARRGWPCRSYVDDILQVVGAADVTRAQRDTQQCMGDLLSPGSLDACEQHKAVVDASEATFIGWSWDVVSLTVSLTKRSVVRFLTRLLIMQHRSSVRVADLQGVCSLASRMVTVIHILKPFSVILYRPLMKRTFRSGDVIIALDESVQAVVSLWIAVLVRAWNNGVSWSTPLNRLVSQPVVSSVQFDGCPGGIGGVVPCVETCSTRADAFFSLAFPCDFGLTSHHQNATEFLAAAFGVATAIVTGARDGAVRFVGDSVSVLSWLKSYSKSEPGLRAATLCGALLSVAGLSVGESKWLGTKENTLPDDLSRMVDPSTHLLLRGVKGNPFPQGWAERALSFCDPRIPSCPDARGWILVLEEADNLAEELWKATTLC